MDKLLIVIERKRAILWQEMMSSVLYLLDFGRAVRYLSGASSASSL